MLKIILSYDESQKIGQHILNGRAYIFEGTRFESDDGEFEEDLELIFKEDDRDYKKQIS